MEIPSQEKLEKPDQNEILECALATSRGKTEGAIIFNLTPLAGTTELWEAFYLCTFKCKKFKSYFSGLVFISNIVKNPNWQEAGQLVIYKACPRILTRDYQETNPASGRVEDLNPGSPDYKTSALNHSATPAAFLVPTNVLLSLSLYITMLANEA